MKIWQRYLLKEMLKRFLLIVFCFYGLYILIDYSSHTGNHTESLFRYYYGEVIQRLDVVFPFALLISTIWTLTTAANHNELIALLSSGSRMKTIMFPIVFLGLLATFLVYGNNEVLLPKALKEQRHLHDIKTINKNKKGLKTRVNHIALKDNTTLIYQHYDANSLEFFDVYWIKSYDQIFHFNRLSKKMGVPIGFSVDVLERDEQGRIHKTHSYPEKAFPKIRFHKRVLLNAVTPPEELSLLKLWEKLPVHDKQRSEREAQIESTFYKKLFMPWLCLIAVIAPARYCVRFSRDRPVFMIYALSLFGLIACYLVLDAFAVMGSRQVVSPTLGLGLPFTVMLCWSLYNFGRT